MATVGGRVGCIDSSLGSIHVSLFLEFSNVFLVSNSLVSKPVRYLRKGVRWLGRRETSTALISQSGRQPVFPLHNFLQLGPGSVSSFEQLGHRVIQ